MSEARAVEERRDRCGLCDGTGRITWSGDGRSGVGTCPKCRGAGHIVKKLVKAVARAALAAVGEKQQ